MHIRLSVKRHIEDIIDQIILQAAVLQQMQGGWSIEERYKALPSAQKTWLDAALIEQRRNTNQWTAEVSLQAARWLMLSFEKICRPQFILGDAEFEFIRHLVYEALGGY